MPSWDAEARAKALLHLWKFPNTYTLGKHLTEYLVQDYQQRFSLPVAVVRPALVSAIARDPYPGYAGEYQKCYLGPIQTLLLLRAHRCRHGHRVCTQGRVKLIMSFCFNCSREVLAW